MPYTLPGQPNLVETAASALDLAIKDLRIALSHASAVEALVLMPMIDRAAALKRDADALASALRCIA